MNYTLPHFAGNAGKSTNLSPTGVVALNASRDTQSNIIKPSFSTARNRTDLLAAFTLLQQRYRQAGLATDDQDCLLYTSPSPRDRTRSRMPSSA